MNGFIYKVISTVGDKVYIGSTQEGLNKRFNRHKRKKDTSIIQLFDEYGMDTCSIHMIEYVKFDSKTELLFRERHWIENTPNCVNIKKPIETENEEKERKKRHYEKVKDSEDKKQRAREATKKYYDSHTEKLREKSRLYAQEHKEERKIKFKEWYDEKKQTEEYQLKQRAKLDRLKEVVQCECGKSYTLSNKSRHMKKHTEK